jgi:hypothetical protein
VAVQEDPEGNHRFGRGEGVTPGGVDTVLATKRPVEILDMAVRFLQRQWPQMVVECAVTGEVYRTFGAIPLAKKTELLLFRDEVSRILAEEDPRIVDMVHLIRGEKGITIVSDVGSKLAASLIAALKTVRLPGHLEVPREVEDFDD